MMHNIKSAYAGLRNAKIKEECVVHNMQGFTVYLKNKPCRQTEFYAACKFKSQVDADYYLQQNKQKV